LLARLARVTAIWPRSLRRTAQGSPVRAAKLNSCLGRGKTEQDASADLPASLLREKIRCNDFCQGAVDNPSGRGRRREAVEWKTRQLLIRTFFLSSGAMNIAQRWPKHRSPKFGPPTSPCDARCLVQLWPVHSPHVGLDRNLLDTKSSRSSDIWTSDTIPMDDAMQPSSLAVQRDARQILQQRRQASRDYRSARVHCPFYRHDPSRHKWPKSCNGVGFDTIYRLKEHLTRDHWVDKASSAPASKRSRKKRSKPSTEMLTESQYDYIRNAKRTSVHKSLGAAWEEIYRIIFPDDPRPPPAFKITEEQIDHTIRNPSPEFLAQLKQRLARANVIPADADPDVFVSALLASKLEMVALLQETGGYFSASRGRPSQGSPGDSDHVDLVHVRASASNLQYTIADETGEKDCDMRRSHWAIDAGDMFSEFVDWPPMVQEQAGGGASYPSASLGEC